MCIRDSYRLYSDKNDKDRHLYMLIMASLTGFILISSLSFPMERIPNMLLFYILIGLVVSKLCQKQLKQKQVASFKLKPVFLIVCTIATVYCYARHQSEAGFAKALHYKETQNWNRLIKAIDKSYSPLVYSVDYSGTPLLWYKGIGYFSKRDFEKAFSSFNKSHDINPNHLHLSLIHI